MQKLLTEGYYDIIQEGQYKIIMDCNGFKYFYLPMDMSNAQIEAIIYFLNDAYDRGYTRGQIDKIQEIKNVLNIKGD